MQLSHFDPALFLRDYWQKKPLLIRNPWGEWRNPLEPDELAGLADIVLDSIADIPAWLRREKLIAD